MTCDEFQKTLMDLTTRIDDDLAVSIEAHFSQCTSCQEEDQRSIKTLERWHESFVPIDL